MNAVSVAAGVLVVAAMALDVGLTVLHPTSTGPISHRVNREVWRLVRWTARTPRSRGVLNFAGPLATVTMMTGWLAGLWVGFALIYLPFVARFSSSGHARPGGLFAALS
jgi:hypothetical protein